MSCVRRGRGARSRASPRSPRRTFRKSSHLKPDLVLTFSDLQADIAAALIKHGVAVHAFNQRTVAEILDMIRTLGALVGAQRSCRAAGGRTSGRDRGARARASRLPWRPKVYFEEWDDPMISGIAWVSELIEVAGGIDVFADLAAANRPRTAS